MLASLRDLVAIGSLPVGVTEQSPEAQKANDLLGMAQNLALDYLDEVLGGEITEDDIKAWTAARQARLVVWIAEKAATRLQTPGAPSVDPYADAATGPRTMKLNRWEKSELRGIARVSSLGVISTTRGPMETGRVRDCDDPSVDDDTLDGLTEADDPYSLIES